MTHRAAICVLAFGLVSLIALCGYPDASRAQPTATSAADTRKQLRQLRSLLGIASAPRDCEDSGEVLYRLGALLGRHPESPDSRRHRGVLDSVRIVLGGQPETSSAEAAKNDLETIRSRFTAGAGASGGAAPTGYIPPDFISHPNLPTLERSYILKGGEDVYLEAQIAQHIVFYENLSRPQLYDKGGNAWSVSFTPMLRLRILDNLSGPIKTLSWMPKLDAMFIHSPLPTKSDGERTASVAQWIVRGTYGHHSNGQDENMFVPDLPDSGPDPATPQDVTVNYPNGSFSTNYLRIAVYHRRFALRLNERFQYAPYRTLQVGAYYENHPRELPIGGDLPSAVRPLYGTQRTGATIEFETRLDPGGTRSGALGVIKRASARLTIQLDYFDKLNDEVAPTVLSASPAPLAALYDAGDGSSRFRLYSELGYNPDFLRGWGLMFRYIDGQDYYNLQYFRNIHWFQLGIMFDPAEFEPFARNK